MEVLKKILLYIWQLPQNILGLIFMLFLLPTEKIKNTGYATVYKSKRMSGGISLGEYAFVSEISSRYEDTIDHEGVGHPKQSRILGPFYLIVIGLPSIIWTQVYGSIVKESKNGYYKFWTEKWADKLAGIVRDFN